MNPRKRKNLWIRFLKGAAPGRLCALAVRFWLEMRTAAAIDCLYFEWRRMLRGRALLRLHFLLNGFGRQAEA